MTTAETALLVSILSFGFSVFVFFKSRADLRRQIAISSLPILDFSARFEHETESTPYLIIDVLNLHSSVAVRDLKMDMKLKTKDGPKFVELSHTGSIARILPKERAISSSYIFGAHISEIRENQKLSGNEADALLGQTLDLEIGYSFQPAVATVSLQNGTIRMEIKCGIAALGRPYIFAKRIG